MTAWRKLARNVIRQALAEPEAEGLTGKELRDYVNKKYPFGAREYYPYKIWLEEMKKLENPSTPANVKNFWLMGGKNNDS